MKKFEYEPLELDTDTKVIGVFNDLVTLHAGIIDFLEKYESQLDTLDKYLSEEDCKNLFHALNIVPKMITDLAPAVQKALSKDEETP